MTKKISLSYVLTTYNKIKYLKLVLQDITDALASDEELIVIDGGSNDGTQQLLEEYHAKGIISLLISERDFGEAHGFNKGILKARGSLIKLISDDDVYNFKKIRQVKEIMLNDASIDLLTSDIAYLALDKGLSITTRLDFDSFIKYKNCGAPFWFNGQTVLFKKDSIPLLGLLHTGMKTVDSEFSLRVTSNRNIRVGYVQDIYSVRIDNPDSNLNKYMNEILEQTNRNFIYYGYKEKNEIDLSSLNLLKILVLRVGNKLKSVFLKFSKWTGLFYKLEQKSIPIEPQKISVDFVDAYTYSVKWLKEYNNESSISIHI